RNSGGITFAGLRFNASSVGSAYCHGCTCTGGGSGVRLLPFSSPKPWTTSGSSGVPRPVGRLPPGPPPRPPPGAPPPPPPPPRPAPPEVELTVNASPPSLYIARLSGTP